ncbi:MAG: PucR family transcriptional regulator ligand-binding domain-containing protein, partial [Chloroflexota bacterium]
EILEHDIFTDAKVVAGEAGLQREVRWVHNAGVPDAAVWLNGGELVMTTIFNMPQDLEDQRSYIIQMADKEVAGLVITTGRYIQEIPRHLRDAANSCAFPLIEIAYTARFVDIAKAINERIAESTLHHAQRSLHIHKTLTQLVLEGGNLEHLAEQLADLIGHSVSIENDRFDAIATHNIAEVDEARHYTQLHGRTDPRLVEALEQESILPHIRETLRPKHLQPMPHVGLEMERILAPIVVHGEIYGFMWIIADEHKLTEIDMMAIESGTTIAALMMLYQESVQSAEASLKGSLMSQLIQGNAGRETILTDTSLRYGVDLRSPYAMMIVECQMSGSQKLSTLYRSINQLIAIDGWEAVVGQFAGQIVVLAQDNEHLKALAARVQERVALSKVCGDTTPRVGVSGIQQGTDNVRCAYDQCQDVLQITRRLDPGNRVIYFSELGYLHTLYHAGPSTLTGNPYVPLLRRLLDERQADLFRTLEAYLDSGGNGVATAESLHIHRSTLNYRLQRIYHVCDVNLQDAAVRTNLQVALKLMRLFEVTESDL